MNSNPHLIKAKLIKRYKRFLADVELNDQTITVHVPNTGSMKGCWEEGDECALSLSSNKERKMPYTLEMIRRGTVWIGINTHQANHLVEKVLKEKKIPSLQDYEFIEREVKINQSRIDFYLRSSKTIPHVYLEVKNVTLSLQDGIVSFPDAVSERGLKHLDELIELKKKGFRTVLVFCIQRSDGKVMKAEESIDLLYAKKLEVAVDEGVEVLPLLFKVTPEGIIFEKEIPFQRMAR